MVERNASVMKPLQKRTNTVSTGQAVDTACYGIKNTRWALLFAVVFLGLPLWAAEPTTKAKPATEVCDDKSQCAVFENKSSVRIYFQVNLGPGNCGTRKSFKNFSLEPGESDRIPVGGNWDDGEVIPGGVDMTKRQACYQLNNLDAVEKCLKDSVLPPQKLPPAVKDGHWCFSDEGAISSCPVCKRIKRRNTVTD